MLLDTDSRCAFIEAQLSAVNSLTGLNADIRERIVEIEHETHANEKSVMAYPMSDVLKAQMLLNGRRIMQFMSELRPITDQLLALARKHKIFVDEAPTLKLQIVELPPNPPRNDEEK